MPDAPDSRTGETVLDLITGWRFGPADAPDDRDVVTLPHTVVPLSWHDWDPATWERCWHYAIDVELPRLTGGARAFLEFDGALTATTPTLNGRELPRHLGGYLPFSYDVTQIVHEGSNELHVLLDSGFDLDVPPNRPGQPSSSVDYWQPGGMAAVRVRVCPAVFVADVFAKPVRVLDPVQRALEVECELDAAGDVRGPAALAVQLRDGDRLVAAERITIDTVTAGRQTAHVTVTGLDDVALWQLDRPVLYDVAVELEHDGRAVHRRTVRTGFREARFADDGFYLNGQRVQLFGLNRHHYYPFAGAAMPDRVQRRDAEILRNELNCTIARCSHYPQAQSFYDACDELGLLVWDEVPGWGHLGDDAWKQLLHRDVEDMIRRARNHPSVVIWGSRANETPDDVALYTRTRDLAHALDDSRATAGAMAGRHDTPDYVEDVFAQNDYTLSIGPDGRQQPELMAPRTDRPYLVTEAVGALSGPAPFYRRTEAQTTQQGQATAHARVHELAARDPRYLGTVPWAGFDYGSGCGRVAGEVKYVGVADLFRVPKPGAAIYRSQVDPQVRAVIETAFYWDFNPIAPVSDLPEAMICSNLERLELFVGDAHHATLRPDTERYGHLAYPPFFADFRDVDPAALPELRVEGHLGDVKTLERRYASDPNGDRLSLIADDEIIDADGRDATRLVVRATDRYGAPRAFIAGPVDFELDGTAVLVGDNPFDLQAAGGAGAVWVRSLAGSPGAVRVRATHDRLGSAAVTIAIRRAGDESAPLPYGSLSLVAAPTVLEPGESARVEVHFANHGRPVLDHVSVALFGPDGWEITADGGAAPNPVGPGESLRRNWTVRAPSAGGKSVLVARARYRGAGVATSTSALIPIDVAFPNLHAIAGDSGVIADDQTVLLGGTGSALRLELSAEPRMPTASGTIHYADGTSAPYALDLVTAGSAPQAVDPVDHSDDVAGTVEIAVDPERTVRAITLPAGYRAENGDEVGVRVRSVSLLID